jgi:cyanophycinase
MSVVASSPSLLGIGIDEDTAIEVTGGDRFTVHGRGGVIVMDCRDVTTDAPDARRGAPLLVSGAIIHTLPAGATFDLGAATLVNFVEQHADVDVSLATARP